MASDNIQQNIHQQFIEGFYQFEAGLNGEKNQAIHDVRAKAFETFKNNGFPDSKDEEYKYTSITKRLGSKIKDLDLNHYSKVLKEPILPVDLEGDVLTFINGRYSSALSKIQSKTSDVEIMDFKEAAESKWQLLNNHFAKYADPESDVNKVTWDTLGLNEYLRDKPRAAAPGEKFNYNTAEANLVGTLLRSAIGNNLSTYLSEKIWKPFGMEFDANWALTELGGGEFGGCCINASLRDYGRIGLFAMGNGLLADGAQVLTESWMAESITSSKGNPGYGYLWWLYEDETYRASGIFGQAIYINTKENIVIAMHSARSEASNRPDWALQSALFEALSKAAKK
jgi:hypothetical protein